MLMPRPKPLVIAEVTNKKTFKTDQVLAADGVWSVFYDGRPINLKTSSYHGHGPGPKYRKVSFSNKGHAVNLCKKLNAQFNTNKFEVFQLGRITNDMT